MDKEIKIGIDTDCIISLFNACDVIHPTMLFVDQLCKEGKINLYVSLKTIDQLSVKGSNALEYAKSLPKLPNYMVGTIGEQVGSIGSLAGTFGDAERNEILQREIRNWTKQGVNMRDRQIVIDSYLGGMEIMLTNDRDLCDEKPSANLQKELGLVVMNPEKLLQCLKKLVNTNSINHAVLLRHNCHGSKI